MGLWWGEFNDHFCGSSLPVWRFELKVESPGGGIHGEGGVVGSCSLGKSVVNNGVSVCLGCYGFSTKVEIVRCGAKSHLSMGENGRRFGRVRWLLGRVI